MPSVVPVTNANFFFGTEADADADIENIFLLQRSKFFSSFMLEPKAFFIYYVARENR
tara:strand:+ start:1220 stop:1390 length:171 start_codon:yes stop_codon:yes gene_type:complete